MKSTFFALSYILGGLTLSAAVLVNTQVPQAPGANMQDFLDARQQAQDAQQRAQNLRIQREQADRERQRFQIEQEERAARIRAEAMRQEALATALKSGPETPNSTGVPSATSLDKIIPPTDQQRMGLAKLTTEEREQLHIFLAGKLLEFYAAGSAANPPASVPTARAIVAPVYVPPSLPARTVQAYAPPQAIQTTSPVQPPAQAKLPTQFELDQPSYWTGKTKFAADGTTYYEYRRQTPEGTVFWSNERPR